MKGRGEIITILCMSVFLICILYAMTYGGIVKAEELEKQPEEAGEKTEVDIEEELRWAEEVKKILKDVGVGFCDETEDKQEDRRYFPKPSEHSAAAPPQPPMSRRSCR